MKIADLPMTRWTMKGIELLQREYDNRLPEDDEACAPEFDEAKGLVWLENGVDQLMRGGDVIFKRRLCSPQGVKFMDFMVAIDEFALEQMSAPSCKNYALGMMVYGSLVNCPTTTREGVSELLGRPAPVEDIRQIAENLLRPFVKDGLEAQAEDDEL